MTTDYRSIIQALHDDPETKDELARCTDWDEAATMAARLAKRHGHDVTPETLRQAFTPPDGELSDTQLETVVGGKGSPDQEIVGDGSLWAQFAYTFGVTEGAVFNDELDGGDGNDTMWGGYGDDTVLGGDGNDSMDGGYGKGDTVDGDDYMDGGAGNDTMWGSVGDDEMYGGEGNDLVHGNEDNDSVHGGDGNDWVHGDEGDDVVHGDAGNDQLFGGTGHDELFGDDGNDTLDGGVGNDTLTGGEGNDVFIFNRNSGTDTITDFDPGHDKFQFDGISKGSDIEVVAGGGNTFITYGETTIIVEGVEMTHAEVLARSR